MSDDMKVGKGLEFPVVALPGLGHIFKRPPVHSQVLFFQTAIEPVKSALPSAL